MAPLSFPVEKVKVTLRRSDFSDTIEVGFFLHDEDEEKKTVKEEKEVIGYEKLEIKKTENKRISLLFF